MVLAALAVPLNGVNVRRAALALNSCVGVVCLHPVIAAAWALGKLLLFRRIATAWKAFAGSLQ